MRYRLAALTLALAGAGCYSSSDSNSGTAAVGSERVRYAPATEVVYYDTSVPGAPVYELVQPVAGEVTPFNPQELRGTAVIRRDQQFEDIPVPLGFRLDRTKLFSFQGSAFRYGKFAYEGQWTYNRTRQFYLDQMPVHEWALDRVGDKYPPNGEIQRYRRGNEIAEITLRRMDVGKVGVEIVVRDNRRPDPMLLADARMNVAPVTPGSTEVVTTVAAGRPYRAPLYAGDSVPGAVALTTTSTSYSVTPPTPPSATVYTTAPAPYTSSYGSSTYTSFDSARPLSQPPPAAQVYAPAPTTTTVTTTSLSGQTVYRSEGVTRTPGSPMPFSTIQGKAVDPRTFDLGDPQGVGIVIR